MVRNLERERGGLATASPGRAAEVPIGLGGNCRRATQCEGANGHNRDRFSCNPGLLLQAPSDPALGSSLACTRIAAPSMP
jgi:hypothetical protein